MGSVPPGSRPLRELYPKMRLHLPEHASRPPSYSNCLTCMSELGLPLTEPVSSQPGLCQMGGQETKSMWSIARHRTVATASTPATPTSTEKLKVKVKEKNLRNIKEE